ncbi:MAG: DUF1232 domain-containing protein [bacterium]
MTEILKQLNKIDAATKDHIERIYTKAVKEFSKEDLDYIADKFERKLFTTENSTFPWIKELAVHYKNLYTILQNHQNTSELLSQEALKLVGAALFYFINPYDIIPDFTPDLGYIDDLFVLITCLNLISGNDVAIIQKYFKELLH